MDALTLLRIDRGDGHDGHHAPEARGPRSMLAFAFTTVYRYQRMVSRALRRVSCRNTKPLLSALFGSTRWPPNSNSLAKSPPRRRSKAAGRRNKAGRCRRRASSSVKVSLVTGIGAVALIGPERPGLAMTWAIRRTRSSRSIQV